MTITIEQIKNLRDKTGVSTTQVKKALEEAGGDEEKAIELLRKKGAAKAAAREGVAGEGVVAIAVSPDNTKAAIIKLNSETDFVAKNQDFVDGAQAIAQKFLEGGLDADVSAELEDLATKMAEKIELNDKEIVEGAVVGAYVHSNNKIGAVTVMTGGNIDTGKDVSMHISASQPRNLSPEEVDQALVDKEIEIWTEQLKAEGKPENIMEKIMEGKIKKFREENALISQPFVKSPDMTVGQLVANEGAEITKFVCYAI